MKIKFYPFHLKMRDTFTIAHGSRNYQQTLVVEITDGAISGYGEVPAISYYQVTLDFLQASLQKIEEKITALHYSDQMEEAINALWYHLHHECGLHPFPHAALNVALYDFFGKKAGKPLWEIWGLSQPDTMITDYTIGIDNINTMIKKMEAMPWPVYKIKLGTEEDIAIIKALRQHTHVPFRIDANGGWGYQEALENVKILVDYNIELVEQPLPPHEWENMKALKAQSPIPLIADESCRNPEDLPACKEGFHGINIKLAKCGGFTPARELIRKGKKMDLQIMGGCMTESTIGISAMAQLGSLFDYLDIDGPLLLSEDPGEGVEIHSKGLKFPNINGTGTILVRKPF